MDKRLEELSNKIVNYSLKLKENEKVLITSTTITPEPFVLNIINEITKIKAIPFVRYLSPLTESKLKEQTTKNRIKELKTQLQNDIDNYDAFINIRYTTNEYENTNIDSNIEKLIGESLIELNDIKINKKRWVLLNYPSRLDAYKAKMTTPDFYNYALETMNVNYQDLYERLKPLKELMEKTDKVRITGPKTDLTFSIKNMNIVPCCGTCNIPDGEIYTAPIKESVNGTITYNTKSPYQGYVFNNISLTFKDGKIIECSSDDNIDKLKEIFESDEGAKYIGEFSLGLNPLIKHPMGDILFDEKIIGSIHLTPGNAYKDAFNGNTSIIHWDLVLIQRKEYGGGEIYFDDVLIRKDGLFVEKELLHLNYNLGN